MYNNAAMEEEDNEEQGGRTSLGSRFGRWISNLTGHAEDEEYEEDDHHHTGAGGGTSQQQQQQATSLRPNPTATGGTYTARTSGSSSFGTARRDALRIAGPREGSITVMPVSSFGDIQKAADRLKAGEPQIINLEKAPEEVAERLIDFLNGVTYALDGYVEKIAEGAYLFTPSHIAIHADGPEEPAPNPFFDRK